MNKVAQMKLIGVVIGLLFMNSLTAQNDPKWDDTQSKDWPAACQQVEITSSVDQEIQPAYFYASKSEKPQPLIISLHTWSGGYEQKDTLSWICTEKDFNYIHPHFRGPNNTPEACGSPLAIQYIDDAIAYAREHGNVDTSEIHIIGVSGGGYATLLAYMKTRQPVKTFSAWVPISNVEDWYYESVGRKQKYAKDIAQATTGKEFEGDYYYFDEKEARARSPFFMETPVEKRQSAKLYIHTGIHDGYTGSVPITQSLKFFNKVVLDFDPSATSELISTEEMLRLVESQNSGISHPSKIEKGEAHLQRTFADKVLVEVFEGSHEMLADKALAPLDGESILTIGDSNGAIEIGWVNQLKKLAFSDFIYNTAISGNTIGFDNNGRKDLNTLRNVDDYLGSAVENLKSLDKIVIMLGTNDCKAVFDDRLKEVPENMKTLIRKIKAHEAYQTFQPKLYVVSPPPYASDDKLIAKYKGGADDIAWLVPRFKEVAEAEGCTFIDVYSKLLPIWNQVTADGIHLKEDGQQLIAQLILENL